MNIHLMIKISNGFVMLGYFTFTTGLNKMSPYLIKGFLYK